MGLGGLSRKLALKGEETVDQEKICDYLLFAWDEQVLLGLVELKGKNVDVEDVKTKFNNGARVASMIADRCIGNGQSVAFYPVLLCKSWRGRNEHIVLTQHKVQFQGRNYRLITKECGMKFIDVVRNFRQDH